ncbi:sensor histidine kinase [Natronoglycomyces albus]|uniref:histidine kinase n=1 Tax=Natronoglycomyces albus TaxID=2811108 RepID=A0A895XIM0_9ACTN|nr:HAMP domain-containing sensor histidine kinase [Natronoglycomyces albus]QSB05184.1 HAMP domain-containing histidine kinase [Natronoglycomyces albus]
MRRRLILLVAATVTLVLISFAVPLGMLLHSANVDRVMTAATQEAEALVPTVATADHDTVAATVEIINRGSDHPITVYWPDGTILGASAERSQAVDLAATGRSFTAEAEDGREILFGVQSQPEGVAVIRTYVSNSDLTAGLGQSYLIMGAIALALLGVGLLIANWLARLLLIPVGELSEVSHRLAKGDLDARAKHSGPAELRDVAEALNSLAGTIQSMLKAERERVADLSHRLRTPLTVLRLETESLRDENERLEIEAAVDEVEAAVNATIDAARHPAATTTSRATGPTEISCDAAAVVADRVRFWSALAEDTNRACHTQLTRGPLRVRVAAPDLSAAMDAALGNVFAHTPDGTAFTVSLRPRPAGGVVIDVVDQGPGLPGDHVRQRGASGGGSTGLGLDIINRTAEAAGGQMTIGPGPDGRGTHVRLTLDG